MKVFRVIKFFIKLKIEEKNLNEREKKAVRVLMWIEIALLKHDHSIKATW